MRKFRLIFLVLMLTGLCASGQQKEGANWLFDGRGSYYIYPFNEQPGFHLDFNHSTPVETPFYFDYAHGIGVATISDKKGNLLFFSSMGRVGSRKIVNNRYQLMPHGDVFNSTIHSTGSELIVQN